MSIRVYLIAMAEVVLTTLAVAQQPGPASDSGARVRVTYSEGGESRTVTGRLAFQDADSLTMLVTTVASVQQLSPPGSGRVAPLRVSTGMASIPRSAISRMELSSGRSSNAGRGALIGGGVGMVAGLGLSIASLCSNTSDSFACIDQPEEVAGVTLLFGLGGAGIGALIGAMSHHEVWRPLPLEPSVTPIIGRRDGGTTIGLSLRF